MLEGLCNETTARWFYSWYSHVYDTLQPFFSSPEMRESGLDLAQVRLGESAGLRVLDAGAGTGTLSLQILKRGVLAKDLVMLDQSSGMLAQARKKAELADVEKVLGDAQSLSFPDASFDRVVSSGAIYYWPNPVRAMAEARRVLKPGGLALAIGTLEPRPMGIRLLAQTFNRFPTEEQYVDWFTLAGFEDIQKVHVANPWNEAQFALAIVGRKPKGGGGAPSDLPPQPTEAAHSPQPVGLLSLAALLARYVIAMCAFAVIGPMQIITAANFALRRRWGRPHQS